MEDFKSSISQLVSVLVNFAPKVVSAIFVLLLGIWFIRLVVKKI